MSFLRGLQSADLRVKSVSTWAELLGRERVGESLATTCLPLCDTRINPHKLTKERQQPPRWSPLLHRKQVHRPSLQLTASQVYQQPTIMARSELIG